MRYLERLLVRFLDEARDDMLGSVDHRLRRARNGWGCCAAGESLRAGVSVPEPRGLEQVHETSTLAANVIPLWQEWASQVMVLVQSI